MYCNTLTTLSPPAAGAAGARGARAQVPERVDDRGVRDILLRAARLPGIELPTPLVADRLRIGEVRLVELLHERRVGAEEVGRRFEILQGAGHRSS
jgi:hypothetical protein